MTAVEIGREVERDLQRWCEEPLEPVQQAQDDGAETTTTVHRAPSADTVGCGIRYQRCGGGRRVIRRQRSEN